MDHSRAAIELLRVAHGLYTRLGPARPARLLYRIGGLMVHAPSRQEQPSQHPAVADLD